MHVKQQDKELQPGDLVVYRNDIGPRQEHVGLRGILVRDLGKREIVLVLWQDGSQTVELRNVLVLL